MSKLNQEAFVELNQNVNKTFYTQVPIVWKEMRLLAVDGSRLVNSPSVEKELGTYHFYSKIDSKRSLDYVHFYMIY